MHCVVVQLSYSVATINSHQDRETLCKNRYARVTADGQKIMELVKQNLGYFQVRNYLTLVSHIIIMLLLYFVSYI